MKKTGAEILIEETLYLINLTVSRLKPLSRIEYPLSAELERYIDERGLSVKKIKMPVADGSIVQITLLSGCLDKISEATALFNDRPISLDSETIRSWGRLLGFPPCCVEFFVDEKTRHSSNNLLPEDQSLLFHWACPDCPVTKRLIPAYREIWNETQLQLNSFVQPPTCVS